MQSQQIKTFLESLTPGQRESLVMDFIKQAQQSQTASERAAYQTEDGIVRFVRDKLHAKPTAYQEAILRALVRHKKVAVRSPHGAGKTALASWIVLWSLFAFESDVKTITTAGAWRQVEKFLWVEIKKWARTVDWENQKPNILNLEIKFPSLAKEAFGTVSDDPAMLEGAHAQTLIYILDEAKSIPDASWDSVEGAFSSAGQDTDSQAFALAFSTPGAPAGRFYDIHKRKPGLQDWHVIHVTLEDAIAAGRISREWAENRKAQWGAGSAVYQNRVLGNFAESAEDCVIPLTWVELANERWHEAGAKGVGLHTLGCDPARYGTDKTSIADLVGRVIEQLTYHAQEDTMQTAGRVAARAGNVSSATSKAVPIGVDVIGIGAGVTDRLRELGYAVSGVNVASAAIDSARRPLKDITGTFTFVNLRSYIWWLLRDNLNPDHPEPLALPPDDKLTGDLTAPTFKYTSNGQIQVEAKDDLRKRLKRSTDGADAVGLALYVASRQNVALPELRQAKIKW